LLNAARFTFTLRDVKLWIRLSACAIVSSESHFTTDGRPDAFSEQCRLSRFLLGEVLNY